MEADLFVEGGIFSLTVVMLNAAPASLVNWYEKIQFLGFATTK